MLLYELKHIALGEFADDLEIGNDINNFFGLPPNESSSTEELVGDARLGSSSVALNLGATLLIGTIIFVVIILIITLAIVFTQKCTCTLKCKERVEYLRRKVYWNPIIRYLILNSLKLNMIVFVAFKANETKGSDKVLAIIILCVLIITPIAFLVAM